MPPGSEGKIPRGRLIPFTFSSQKHREQFLKRLNADGDNVIVFGIVPSRMEWPNYYIRSILNSQSEY